MIFINWEWGSQFIFPHLQAMVSINSKIIFKPISPIKIKNNMTSSGINEEKNFNSIN